MVFYCFNQVADGLKGVNNGRSHSDRHWVNNNCISNVVTCNNMYVLPL